ncbi:Eukaryotic translation initiation factor 3 subunit C [Smittium mucronatum]|uniref:Eukaryotic translation initiation factor 3 subunit C n=1 Tax=Smittium mucronatum TaxID=133383 RepID=A0A1R0H2X4_9FUNG|nr:Eukaryotic translation initiation factor 3 subunit C [Smittium mucronatum]
MSKFFKGDSSDSDSDITSSSDSDFSDNDFQDKNQTQTSRFSKSALSGSDDSEDDVKRVVKSAKDKQSEEAVSSSKAIKKSLKADEWTVVLNEFEKLTKLGPKLKRSDMHNKLPVFFTRSLVEIDTNLLRFKDKSASKKLNADVARSLNTVRQRIKKVLKDYEAEVKEFRQNPILSDEEIEEEIVAEIIPKVEKLSVSSKTKTKSKSNDDDSSDSYWDNSESSDESSSSEDEGPAEKKGISKWLKREPTKSSVSESKDKKKADQESKTQRALEKKAKATHEEEGEEEDDGFTTVGRKQQKKAVVYTAETLSAKLLEILESRGRKGADKSETLSTLYGLLKVSANDLQKTKVLLLLIPTQFDYFPSTSSYLQSKAWNEISGLIDSLLTILENNPDITVSETSDVAFDSADDSKYVGGKITLAGSIIGFLDRLFEEFIKSLSSLDPHTPEYVERMTDDVTLYITIVRVQNYLNKCKDEDGYARAIMRRVEFLYFRPDQVVLSVEASMAKKLGIQESTDPNQLLHDLCTYIYSHSNPMLRARAMLMQIYNHALNKRYYIARDLFLMSHVQDNILQADVATQILFNRSLAQLGLASFRLGLFQESFGHLQDIMSSGKVRELLGQGVGQQRYSNLTAEQEILSRHLQLPFHMHINFELLECVFLVASMLLEIPFMASTNNSAGTDSNKRAISKVFRRMFDFNERQVFIGPPENTRDHIMASAKSLATGRWDEAYDYIKMIKIWSLMPDFEEVMEFLLTKIKVEALRTYIFTYFTHYNSLGIKGLASMFDLSSGKVTSLLAMMIYNGEINASLDEVQDIIKFTRISTGASLRLQQVTLQLADKVSSLAETNEKMYELKVNGGKPFGGERSVFQQNSNQEDGSNRRPNRQPNRQQGRPQNRNNRTQGRRNNNQYQNK